MEVIRQPWNKDLLKMPIANPAGLILYPYGVQTYSAEWLNFVCFDDFPWVGGMLHCIRMEAAKKFVEAKVRRKHLPIFGSTEHNSQPNTGAGYLASPEELGARSFALSKNNSQGEKLSVRGANVVKQMLDEWGIRWRPATLDEQKSGIDIVCLDPPDHRLLTSLRGKIEVKARGENKAFPDIFLQTHEANTERRYE